MSGDEQQQGYQDNLQTNNIHNGAEDASMTPEPEMSDSAVEEIPILEEIAPEPSEPEAVEVTDPVTEAEAPQKEIPGTEALQQQIEALTGQYMRIAADFDNFRKRTEREKSDLEQRVKRETISELLPVIDSFERAKSHINPQTDQEITIQKSYQGVYKQLVDCLKRIGVAPMRAKGKEFDPNLHEAVMREPTDQFDEGAVMEELVNGYMLGEVVLRHAMVKVAAPAEPMLTSEENQPSTPNNQVSE